MKLGFAGAGNMAAAMARGWARADDGPEVMLFADLDSERAQALAQETGGETRGSLGELVAGSDVMVLAVKPAALDSVAEELGGQAPPILSVLAATPVSRLKQAFPGTPVLRVMPNQPVEVGAGLLCYVEPDQEMPADLAGELVQLLGSLGHTVALAEDDLEAAMAVMSCSPAYVALFAKALACAGAAEGLDSGLSRELVAGTLEGTARLLRVKEPTEVMAAVAPPGGATEAGLEALAAGGFTGTVERAVEASLERFR